MTSSATQKLIELVRELVAKFDEGGEYLEDACPVCNGDKEFDACLVAQSGAEEGDLVEARVFCNCHDGKVEALVKYDDLDVFYDMRDIELALIQLDVEEACAATKVVKSEFAGEFGDAHHKLFVVEPEHHGESPPFTPQELTDFAAREYQRRSPRPPEELVGALQDRIFPSSGHLITSVPVRRRRKQK